MVLVFTIPRFRNRAHKQEPAPNPVIPQANLTIWRGPLLWPSKSVTYE